MKLRTEQIKSAVRWWVEVLASPKFDNGAYDPINKLACLIASQTAPPIAIDSDELQRFGAALETVLSTDGTSEMHFALGVDYAPFGKLKQAAQMARLDTSRFPFKTNMRFENGGVSARHGYNGERVEVLAALFSTGGRS